MNISFANDLLLFTRRDLMSVQLAMQKFNEFSEATRLYVNPDKCRAYFGNVDLEVKNHILQATGFKEGPLPFRHLGIPLTSRKLSVNHCLVLVEKIVCRIKHWMSRLLSFAGRTQLIKSVLFAINNFWMQCLPLPKQVIHCVEAVCRSFLWTGMDKVTRKSPVAWKSVCKPKKNGGLNLIDMMTWNKACMVKNLWNLSGKTDSLWIRWIHCYYVKGNDILTMAARKSISWIMKKIMKVRDDIGQKLDWATMLKDNKFHTKSAYFGLLGDAQNVFWKSVMYGNMARPKARHTL